MTKTEFQMFAHGIAKEIAAPYYVAGRFIEQETLYTEVAAFDKEVAAELRKMDAAFKAAQTLLRNGLEGK